MPLKKDRPRQDKNNVHPYYFSGTTNYTAEGLDYGTIQKDKDLGIVTMSI